MSSLENLTKMPLPKKVFFLVFLMALVAVAFWFVWYSPQRDELVKLETSHKNLVAKLREAEKKKKTYDEDRLRRDELKESSTKQLQMLPAEPEMFSFLNNLSSRAELVGLEILAVKPMDEESAKYYARIPVKLTLRGGFHQLSKFFFLVSSLDRIINVENFELAKPEVDESGTVITTTVLATTFRSLNLGSDEAAKGKGGKKNKK